MWNTVQAVASTLQGLRPCIDRLAGYVDSIKSSTVSNSSRLGALLKDVTKDMPGSSASTESWEQIRVSCQPSREDLPKSLHWKGEEQLPAADMPRRGMQCRSTLPDSVLQSGPLPDGPGFNVVMASGSK